MAIEALAAHIIAFGTLATALVMSDKASNCEVRLDVNPTLMRPVSPTAVFGSNIV